MEKTPLLEFICNNSSAISWDVNYKLQWGSQAVKVSLGRRARVTWEGTPSSMAYRDSNSVFRNMENSMERSLSQIYINIDCKLVKSKYHAVVNWLWLLFLMRLWVPLWCERSGRHLASLRSMAFSLCVPAACWLRTSPCRRPRSLVPASFAAHELAATACPVVSRRHGPASVATSTYSRAPIGPYAGQ